MKIYDISWPITPAMTEYKNKESVVFSAIKTFAKDGIRESSFCLNAHTGTHIDAPAHFLNDGLTIDQIHLDRCIGPAKVIDCMTVVGSVTADDLERYRIEEGDIILLRTSNSALSITEEFKKNFIALDISGAQYLAQKKVKAVGIDYLGIEHSNPEHITHTTLMKADILIIEGLRLAHVQAGNYFMVCLPLAIVGLESAPARVILMV